MIWDRYNCHVEVAVIAHNCGYVAICDSVRDKLHNESPGWALVLLGLLISSIPPWQGHVKNHPLIPQEPHLSCVMARDSG